MFAKSTRIPVGIFIIAAFYLLGAVVLSLSFFTNRAAASRAIASAHDLPSSVDGFILPVVACLALFMALGLLIGSRWGYFLSMAYLLTFCVVSVQLLIQGGSQPYLGNLTWSFFALIYLIGKRKYFISGKGDNL